MATHQVHSAINGMRLSAELPTRAAALQWAREFADSLEAQGKPLDFPMIIVSAGAPDGEAR